MQCSHCFQKHFDDSITRALYSIRFINDGSMLDKRNTAACTWQNKESLVGIGKCWDILIKCLAHFVSANDFTKQSSISMIY